MGRDADPLTNAVRVTLMTPRDKLGDPPVIETVPNAASLSCCDVSCALPGGRGVLAHQLHAECSRIEVDHPTLGRRGSNPPVGRRCNGRRRGLRRLLGPP
jgi:hypothetical protein